LHPQRKDPDLEHQIDSIPVDLENEEEVPLPENGRPKRKCVQFEKNVPPLTLRKKKKKAIKSYKRYDTPVKQTFVSQKQDAISIVDVSSTDVPDAKAGKNEKIPPFTPKTSVSTKESAGFDENSTSNRPPVFCQNEQMPQPENSDPIQKQMLQILMSLQKEISDLRNLTSEQQKQLETFQRESLDAKAHQAQHTHLMPSSQLLSVSQQPTLSQLMICDK